MDLARARSNYDDDLGLVELPQEVAVGDAVLQAGADTQAQNEDV